MIIRSRSSDSNAFCAHQRLGDHHVVGPASPKRRSTRRPKPLDRIPVVGAPFGPASEGHGECVWLNDAGRARGADRYVIFRLAIRWPLDAFNEPGATRLTESFGMSNKIVTVLGARPQFIKASVVSQAFARCAAEVVVHTGQHFDANMSDVFFADLAMSRRISARHPRRRPRCDDRPHAGRSRDGVVGRGPSAVLVYGDTNSTLAGALAAIKLHIPVAHVEAGLRSFNMAMPEEVNRILTDRIARWLFTPTGWRRASDARGCAGERIVAVGDVMYDVALLHAERVDADGRTPGRLGLGSGSYALVTVIAPKTPTTRAAGGDRRRAEGRRRGSRWSGRSTAHASRAAARGDSPQSAPASPDRASGLPRHGAARNVRGGDRHRLGGVQKEAFFHEVPCVTLRDETEWVELVDGAGTAWHRRSRRPP